MNIILTLVPFSSLDYNSQRQGIFCKCKPLHFAMMYNCFTLNIFVKFLSLTFILLTHLSFISLHWNHLETVTRMIFKTLTAIQSYLCLKLLGGYAFNSNLQKFSTGPKGFSVTLTYFPFSLLIFVCLFKLLGLKLFLHL